MHFRGNKELVKNILTVIISTVLSLLLAEVVTRVYIFGWGGLSYSKMESYVNLKDSGLLQSASDGPVLYELKPNLNTTFRFNSLKTNPQGLRDEYYPYKKPQNSIRIVTIGDSYTMGWGVERGASYPDLLQNTLNHKYATKFEVINFGVPGYDLLDYWEVLRNKAPAYNPDIVLLGFCEKNDFEKSVRKGPEIMEGKARKRSGFYRSYLVALIKRTIRVHNSTRPDWSDKNSLYLKNSFKKFGAITKSANIPVVVVYLSLEPQVPGIQIIQKLAKENNLLFIDASTEFIRLNPKNYMVDILDSHPNEEAHRIFTEAILKNQKLGFALEKATISQATSIESR